LWASHPMLVECVCAYSSPLFNQLACSQGDLLHVDWEKSNISWIWCRGQNGQEGFVPADHLRPYLTAEEQALHVLVKDCETETLLCKDMVFRSPKKAEHNDNATFSFSFSFTSELLDTNPPILAPGLSSLVWPLDVTAFMGQYVTLVSLPKADLSIKSLAKEGLCSGKHCWATC
jgi:hypothetical protein